MGSTDDGYTDSDGTYTGGWSGSDASRDRAVTEERTGRRQRRSQEVLRYVTAATSHGVTWNDVSHRLNIHHGAASGALSNLHKAGKIARLTERRGGSSVYVGLDWVDGRATAPHGRSQRIPRPKREAVPLPEWRPEPSDGEPVSIEQAVFQALGAASACWTEVGKAGVFMSDMAERIGDGLLRYIDESHVAYTAAVRAELEQAIADRNRATHEVDRLVAATIDAQESYDTGYAAGYAEGEEEGWQKGYDEARAAKPLDEAPVAMVKGKVLADIHNRVVQAQPMMGVRVHSKTCHTIHVPCALEAVSEVVRNA